MAVAENKAITLKTLPGDLERNGNFSLNHPGIYDSTADRGASDSMNTR